MFIRMYRAIDPAYIIFSVAFFAILAAAVETDIFVPSMPGMQEYFGTTAAKIQMLISMNFMGLCVSGIIFGPLSDAYGRRVTLLVGLAIFTLGGIGCVYSNTINQLLFWRFAQGLGASACFVIPSALIYDLFDKEKAAQVLGYYNSAITIVMAGCPMLGAYLYLQHGWEYNFYFMMGLTSFAWLACLIFVKETLPYSKRQPLNIRQILKGYRLLLTNRVTALNLTVICALFSALFVYISNQSLVFVDYLHVPENIFPFYQGAGVLSFSIASLKVGSAINRYGASKVRQCGNILCCLGVSLMLFVGLVIPEVPWMITLSICFFSTGLALLLVMVFGDYMEVFPAIKGISSSLVTSLRLAATSLVITLSGVVFNGSILPVAVIMFLLTAVSLGCLIFLKRHEKSVGKG